LILYIAVSAVVAVDGAVEIIYLEIDNDVPESQSEQ
jgi:hypothetical protein